MQPSALPVCSRLPWRIDLPPLLEALQRLDPRAWQGHFNTAYYVGDWSGIDLIAAEDARLPLAPGQGAPRSSGWWHAEPAWSELFATLHTPILSARLLRLGPCSRIHEHRDYDLGQPGNPLRLHVPLLSPAEVEFLLDGRRVPMRPGECWFLDLSRPHRVENPGTRERIHLVLDCASNTWLQQAIAAGLPGTPALEPSEATRAFLQFRQQVAEDRDLERQLRSLQDIPAFIAATLRLGAERGLHFAEAEVRAAMRQGKNAWSAQWKV